MASNISSLNLKDNVGGLPLFVWLLGFVAVVFLLYRRGSSSNSNSSAATSVVNASNSPTAAGTYSGHSFTPATEPGTAIPAIDSSGQVQYGDGLGAA